MLSIMIENDETAAVFEVMSDEYHGDKDEFDEVVSVFEVMNDKVDGNADAI